MKKTIVTIIMFVILVTILVFVGYKIVNKGIDMKEVAEVENINTDMLLIQAKAKNIKDQSILKNDESLLKGQKLIESDAEYIKSLKEKEIIKEEEETYKDYYIWDANLIKELNLNVKLPEGEVYIVNYTTNEVIATKAFKVPGNSAELHKLNDIKVEEE